MLSSLKKINIFKIRNLFIRKLHDRKLPEIKYNKTKLPLKNKYIGVHSPKKADFNRNTLNNNKIKKKYIIK